MDDQYKQSVLIIGAGPGGSALLDIFSKEPQIKIVGIVENNPDAPGMQLAKSLHIKVYKDIEKALKESSDCIVFNMTHDPSLADVAAQYVGAGSVIGGEEAKFFWLIINRLQAVKSELLENQIRLQAVIYNVREGIILIDPKGVIENANPATSHIFGYTIGELLGKPIKILMPEPSKDKAAQQTLTWKELLTETQHMAGHSREIVALHKSGKSFPLEINMAEMQLDGLKHFVGIVRDITERKMAEEKLTQMALYDQLTGLPNRRNFFEKLEFSISNAQRTKSMVALLFVDLDGFKKINDTMGHAMGDHVLKEVAQRLQDNTRDSDTAARVGGDEFTVILNNLQNIDDAASIADKIITAINQPIVFDEHSFHVGASIGISIYPDHTEDINALLNAADAAMYRAKDNGKNKYEVAEKYKIPKR